MEKIIKIFINISFALALLISELLLMIQLNISKCLRQNDINKIIDNTNIKNEIEKSEEYNELKEKINPELLDNIINNEEVEKNIKTTLKTIYSNIINNRKHNIDNRALKEIIYNIEIQNETTEEEIKLIEEKINQTTNLINDSDTKILSSLISKKTTNFMLLITLSITIIILLINKIKEGYIYVGIPTIAIGSLFLLIELILSKTLILKDTNETVLNFVNTSLPSLIKSLKTTSIFTIIIGTVFTLLHLIEQIKEVKSNGEI